MTNEEKQQQKKNIRESRSDRPALACTQITTSDQIWQNENIWGTLIRICRQDLDAEAACMRFAVLHSNYSNCRIFVTIREHAIWWGFDDKWKQQLSRYLPIHVHFIFLRFVWNVQWFDGESKSNQCTWWSFGLVGSRKPTQSTIFRVSCVVREFSNLLCTTISTTQIGRLIVSHALPIWFFGNYEKPSNWFSIARRNRKFAAFLYMDFITRISRSKMIMIDFIYQYKIQCNFNWHFPGASSEWNCWKSINHIIIYKLI